MRLIGLNGLKTSGKDTVYECLQESWPNVERAAFADRLKIMAAEALGMVSDDKQVLIECMNTCKESWEFEIHDRNIASALSLFSGREYLQWFGTAGRKAFHDTFWIDAVLPAPLHGVQHATEDLESMYPKADVVVVTDVRYPNEAERVNSLGGEMWEVVRPGLEPDGHPSEEPLPKEMIKYQINNDGSIADLKSLVKLAFAGVL